MTESVIDGKLLPKKTFFGFPYGYWMLNGIEMFERMAYFLVRSVVAIYIMQADEPGGLHFTAAQKGMIYGFWFVFQSILPMFTGGLADRYGYKRTLFFSFTMNIIGYVLMAHMRTYSGFFIAVMVLATGTAFFKPAVQGSLAQNLTKKNSSVGWGIFYWVVNIGAAIAPLTAAFIRDGYTWRILFLVSACITSLNYLMLFTFKDFPSGADKTENPLQVLKRTMKDLADTRLLAWLLIMSCFWLMMYQLWDLHPNFITDWIDTGSMAIAIQQGVLPNSWIVELDRGLQVRQEILLNLNAALIILLMIPVSWVVRKLRTLEAMVIGMGVATCGILVAGLTNIGSVFLLGVVFFSLGEMLTGPKKNEYLSLISPHEKKGQYLGYANIPVGVGGFIGSLLAGFFYGHYGDKSVLAQKYLLQHTELGIGKVWSGNPDHLTEILGVPRTEAMMKLQEVLNIDAIEGTRLLWETYSPHLAVWIPFATIGVIAIVALAIFANMAKRWSDMNA